MKKHSRHLPTLSSSSSSQIITIDLSFHPAKTPLGIILAPTKTATTASNNNPQSSTTIVLVGYTRHEYQMGPIQKSNLIHIGDILVEINGKSVRNMSFRRVLDLLQCLVHEHNMKGKGAVLTSLGFEVGGTNNNATAMAGNNSGGHYNNIIQNNSMNADKNIDFHNHNHHMNIPTAGMTTNLNEHHHRKWNVGKDQTLYSFHSYIHRARIKTEQLQQDNEENDDNDEQQNLYIQYEIKCHLIIKSNNQQEEEISWSTWKRYTEFKNLDEQLRQTFGWYMEGINFPPINILSTVLYGTIHSKFVQKRRTALDIYWKELLFVEGLFDFGDESSRRYSLNVAEFLNIKREYFQSRNSMTMTTTTMMTSNNHYAVGSGGFGASSSVSLPSTISKPKVILTTLSSSTSTNNNNNDNHGKEAEESQQHRQEREGDMNCLDESTISLLSNSVDESGITPAVDTLTTEAKTLVSSKHNTNTSDKRNTSGNLSLSGSRVVSGKKKKRRVAAKAAFQRRLMDDL